MKLLVVLLFFGIFGAAWLFFRVKEVAGSAISAAKKELEKSSPTAKQFADLHSLADNMKKNALFAAKSVDFSPELQKEVFIFSMWVQQRLSFEGIGAVDPRTLRSDALKTGAAVYMGAALLEKMQSFAEELDESSIERFFRRAMTECVGIEVGRGATENAVQLLLADNVPEQFEFLETEGELDMAQTQKGHEPLPFENRLADALKSMNTVSQPLQIAQSETPSGVCERCDQLIPLDSKECPRCNALFGGDSRWRVSRRNRHV